MSATASGDYPVHTEQSYRQYWATLTGKSPAEIYVPESIRLDGFEESQ